MYVYIYIRTYIHISGEVGASVVHTNPTRLYTRESNSFVHADADDYDGADGDDDDDGGDDDHDDGDEHDGDDDDDDDDDFHSDDDG